MKMPVDTPIFGMLKSRLDALSTRQKTIAENVANASTPGYRPRDVDMEAFAKQLEREQISNAKSSSTSIAVTNSGHIRPTGQSSLSPTVLTTGQDSEVTLDGNAVVVEEQMMKMAETRTEYETALGLYQKALGLIRIAGKAPN